MTRSLAKTVDGFKRVTAGRHPQSPGINATNQMPHPAPPADRPHVRDDTTKPFSYRRELGKSWRAPTADELGHEYDKEYRHVKERFGDIFPTKQHFLNAASQAKVAAMPDDLENIDEPQNEQELRAVIHPSKNIDQIKRGLLTGAALPAPIVVHHQGQNFLMAGNTRRAIAHIHNIPKHALLVGSLTKSSAAPTWRIKIKGRQGSFVATAMRSLGPTKGSAYELEHTGELIPADIVEGVTMFDGIKGRAGPNSNTADTGMHRKAEPHDMHKSLAATLEKGLHGDWRKEGYTLHHEVTRGATPDDVTHHITARKDGIHAGQVNFFEHEGGLHPTTVGVAPEHQRKGLASAMYQHAEQQTGKKILHKPGHQLPAGKALWNQKNRPFGEQPTKKPGMLASIADRAKRMLGKSEKPPLTVCSVAVIDPKTNTILMGQRNDNGRWTNPGGKLEAGESPLTGALRELYEEAGVKATRLTYLGTETIAGFSGRMITVHAYVLYGRPQTTGRFDPDQEVTKWSWVPFTNKLPDNVAQNLHSPKNVTLRLLGLQ